MLDSEINDICGHLAAIAIYYNYANFHPIINDCQTMKL